MFIFLTGGGLDPNQVFAGANMGDFNLWSTAMTVEQLNAMQCGQEGDVVSMHSLENIDSTATPYLTYTSTCDGNI